MCDSKSPSAWRTNCVSEIIVGEEISERSSGCIQDSAREKGQNGKKREEGEERKKGKKGKKDKNPRNNTGGFPDKCQHFLELHKKGKMT